MRCMLMYATSTCKVAIASKAQCDTMHRCMYMRARCVISQRRRWQSPFGQILIIRPANSLFQVVLGIRQRGKLGAFCFLLLPSFFTFYF